MPSNQKKKRAPSLPPPSMILRKRRSGTMESETSQQATAGPVQKKTTAQLAPHPTPSLKLRMPHPPAPPATPSLKLRMPPLPPPPPPPPPPPATPSLRLNPPKPRTKAAPHKVVEEDSFWTESMPYELIHLSGGHRRYESMTQPAGGLETQTPGGLEDAANSTLSMMSPSPIRVTYQSNPFVRSSQELFPEISRTQGGNRRSQIPVLKSVESRTNAPVQQREHTIHSSQKPASPPNQTATPKALSKPISRAFSQATTVDSDEGEKEPEPFDYTLQIKLFFEDIKEPIHSDFEVKSVEGTCNTYLGAIHRRSMDNARAWADKKNWSCHRISCRATPSYERLTKADRLQIQLEEDGTAWRRVETLLRQYHNSNKKALTVEVIYTYARQANGEKPQSDVPSSQQAKSTNKQKTPSQPQVFGRATKLLLDQREEEASEATKAYESLAKAHVCSLHRCPNTGRHCWSHKGEHYPLNVSQIKTWAYTLSLPDPGETTASTPSPGVRAELIKAKKHQRRIDNAERKSGSLMSQTPFGPSATPQLQYQSVTPQPQYPQYPQGGPLSIKHMRTSVLEEELYLRQRQKQPSMARVSTTTTMDIGPSEPTLRSSPVEADIEDYFHWLKSTDIFKDRKHGRLDQAFDALDTKGYTTDIIQKWKGNENEERWEKLGIPGGIGQRLARNVSIWARNTKPARSMPLRPSPRKRAIRVLSASQRRSASRVSSTLKPSIEEADGGDGTDLDTAFDEEDEQDESGQAVRRMDYDLDVDLDDTQGLFMTQ